MDRQADADNLAAQGISCYGGRRWVGAHGIDVYEELSHCVQPTQRSGEQNGKRFCGCSMLSVTGELPGSSTKCDFGWRRRC